MGEGHSKVESCKKKAINQSYISARHGTVVSMGLTNKISIIIYQYLNCKNPVETNKTWEKVSSKIWLQKKPRHYPISHQHSPNITANIANEFTKDV